MRSRGSRTPPIVRLLSARGEMGSWRKLMNYQFCVMLKLLSSSSLAVAVSMSTPTTSNFTFSLLSFPLDLDGNLLFFSQITRTLFNVSFVIISASFIEQETVKGEILGGYILNYANYPWFLAFQGVVCQIRLFDLDLSWPTLIYICSFLLYTDIISTLLEV